MSDIGRPQEAVERLRELHGDAVDEDRRRAALLLGLAIADLVAFLPDRDSRRGELAAEGLSRLDESGDASASTLQAKAVLTRVRPANQGPEYFSFPGADLNWDVDWETLGGATAAARQLASVLPMLTSAFPPHDPVRLALRDITDVLDAFDRGQWSPEADAVLASAIRQAEQGGLAGVGPILRVVAMVIRMRRCRLAEQEGQQPDWPPLTDIDVLIADMPMDEVAESFFGPFQPVAGLQHLWMAGLISMRIMVDVRSPAVRRDSAWRDDVLRLIDRADNHLSQAPQAYAGVTGQIRNNLASVAGAVRQAWVPDASPPRPSPAAPASRSAPPRPVPEPRLVPEPAPAQADNSAGSSWTLDGGLARRVVSPDAVAGLRMLGQMADSATITALAHLAAVAEAVIARRWTAAAEQELAELEQQAGRLIDQPDSPPRVRAVVTAILAMARASKWRLTSSDPRLTKRPSVSAASEVLDDVEAAIALLSVAAESSSAAVLTELQGLLHAEAASLLTDLGWPGADHPDAGLIRRSHEHMAQVPEAMLGRFPAVMRDAFLLRRIVADGTPPTAEQADRLATVYPEVFETTGPSLQTAEAAVVVARQKLDLESIGSALNELNKVGIALPAGSPLHIRRLVLRAEVQTLLAAHSSELSLLTDAIGTVIDASRAVITPADKKAVAVRFIAVVSLMTVKNHVDGPFEQAETFLRATLEDAGADDGPLRATAMVGIGAVADMRAAACGDQRLHDTAIALVGDAERLLPEPLTGDWIEVARIMYRWTSVRAMSSGDADVAPIALRVADMLEGVPDSDPRILASLRECREQLLAVVAGRGTAAPERGVRVDPSEANRRARLCLERAAPLTSADRPDPKSLRDAVTDLHAAFERVFTDVDLRRKLDEALGRCEAELYWADADAQTMPTLREAIVHLNRALSSGGHALPSRTRADLLDILARCRREVGLTHENEYERAEARIEANRAARAAIRELARCVMLAEETGSALRVAAPANEIVARSIAWCIADGNHREAVEIAEAGRGLVLASVVLAGQVEEVLRGAGEHDIADSWRTGSEQGRLAALRTLWDPRISASLLASPTVDEISVMLTTTRMDAVVYLVPPSSADAPGHALLVRPLLSAVEVLPLPGLSSAGRKSLDAFLSAQDSALTSFDPNAINEEGFRGGPMGPAWADALVQLGFWSYDRIVGPLIEHINGWNLDHQPHIALVPIGELAAVPFATACTQDATSEDSRRYAIEEVVLTYAASARLLAEVSRRPRQAMSGRVVLVSDPTGGFPMTRRAARVLASHQYPRAEVYGLGSAPNGRASTDVLLNALPGMDRPGASLFQLSTHGTMDPLPCLQTSDGWLALSRILEQARGRPPDAPGGLVITNACLTDSTRTNYDESLTLATAFLAAGASAVIGTRWPVDDDTTSALSLRLHYHLQLGKPPADALRCAQLDLLRPENGMRESLGRDLAALDESRLRHPASWAGYVHHGI